MGILSKTCFLPVSSNMNPGQLLLYDISSEFQGQEGGGEKKSGVIPGHLLKNKILNYNNYKFEQL